MATAANPTATMQKPRREMTEVKEPEQFQFAKQGDTLSGIFFAIEPTSIKDKKTGEQKATNRYFFLDDDGQRITCLGKVDLDKKLWPGLLGFWLDVRYETDQRLPGQQADHSAMQIFKITRGKTKEPGFEHLGVAA